MARPIGHWPSSIIHHGRHWPLAKKHKTQNKNSRANTQQRVVWPFDSVPRTAHLRSLRGAWPPEKTKQKRCVLSL
jgi:hypothetical protein